MSDTILSGKLTVYYLDEDRRKQIRWTGTTAKDDVQKQIDVFDATEDLMSKPTQQNDGLIYSAETPGEYTIGKIDAGDLEPWFIDMKTMEHIIGDYQNFTGCALKTAGWKRVTGTNTGIVVVPVASGGAIVPGDIGNTISHADLDAGTLLDVIITGGAVDYLWIRPDTSTAADDWDSASGNITEAGSSHVSVQDSASITGEMVWGNFYTSGALVGDTHIFVYQNGVRVTSVDETDQDWWIDNHADRAIPITDYTTDNFPIIDSGYLTIKANQYGSKYTYSIIRMNSTSGGNVSAGISSGVDGNNTTGYGSITYTDAAGNWSVGDEIGPGSVSGARAIITQIDSPGTGQTVHYYLVGDPLVDFDNGVESIPNDDDTGTGSKNGSAPALQGPALTTWFDGNLLPTYAFANIQSDIDGDDNDEEYGVSIDLKSCSLAQMHEYNKFAHSRGSILDQDGLDGQEWIGLDYAINYATISGTVPEGNVVTGATSGAVGTVVSNPGGSANTALLRNSRGTFVDGERIYETDGVNEFDASGLTVEVIVPVAESSFGTLAGVNFYASRGILLVNYKSAEENSFSLIDATGVSRARPTSITMEILNLKQYDIASCLRLLSEGGAINKTEYSATGSEVPGDTTITVDGSIAADVPNKDNGGVLFLRDKDDSNQEYVIRFSSFVPSTGVISLANIDVASADTGTDTDTVVETGAFANAKRYDLVYNHDQTAISYVSEVVSDDEITIDPPIAGQTVADHIELNCVPITIDTLDDISFTIIFEFQESDGSASASMQFVSTIYAQVRVRNTSDAAQKMKGYTSAVTIGSGGGTASTTRIDNTVYGS